jgi:hypothetical protein
VENAMRDGLPQQGELPDSISPCIRAIEIKLGDGIFMMSQLSRLCGT